MINVSRRGTEDEELEQELESRNIREKTNNEKEKKYET